LSDYRALWQSRAIFTSLDIGVLSFDGQLQRSVEKRILHRQRAEFITAAFRVTAAPRAAWKRKTNAQPSP